MTKFGTIGAACLAVALAASSPRSHGLDMAAAEVTQDFTAAARTSRAAAVEAVDFAGGAASGLEPDSQRAQLPAQ